jgi:hypothetical protein
VETLAGCRVFFYGIILALYVAEDFSFFAQWTDMHWKPLWCLAWLPQAALPPREGVQLLQMIFKASLLACAVGWRFRFASWVAFLSGFLLLAFFYSATRVSHEMAAVCLAFGVMACSRAADVWSLDAWRGKILAGDGDAYGWPVRVVRMLISLVFFGAGYSKLNASGLAWIFSDHLQLLLGGRGIPAGVWMSGHLGLCQMVAAATVVLELLHPLSLCFRRAAWIFVPGGICMLLGFYFLMGVEFFPLLALHVFWIPWGLAAGRRRQKS